MDVKIKRSRSAMDLSIAESPAVRTDAHPDLSAADRTLLAQRIALIDGITFAEANQYIEDFLTADLNAVPRS